MDIQGPSAKEIIEKLQQFMQRCETLLDENIDPDLTGLDSQVEELSELMHELKFDELQNLQPVLQGLMDQLLNLENQLKRQQEKVRDSIQGLAHKKQAHTAYQKTQASVPEDKKSDTEGGEG